MQYRRHSPSLLRYDKEGVGKSSGDLKKVVMSDWIEDILALIDVVVSTGPIILVASSMGGWVATYVASIRRQRIKALVLIGKF